MVTACKLGIRNQPLRHLHEEGSAHVLLQWHAASAAGQLHDLPGDEQTQAGGCVPVKPGASRRTEFVEKAFLQLDRTTQAPALHGKPRPPG